jgi:hypothetical protein
MSEIALWKLKDVASNNEMDIKTPFIEREIAVPTKVMIPLYEAGVLVSDERLAELGLTKVGYTQEQLDTAYYAGLYAANPDLATRVRQYKAKLDELAVDYAASMDDITAAITDSVTITDKAAYATELNAIYNAIITNLEFCGSATPHMDAYLELAKLIQYLPEA